MNENDYTQGAKDMLLRIVSTDPEVALNKEASEWITKPMHETQEYITMITKKTEDKTATFGEVVIVMKLMRIMGMKFPGIDDQNHK